MKRVMLLFGIFLSVIGVMADENVLQTIEIEPVKDTYNIVLVSDKAVDVKKTVQSENKINLILKDIRASKTLNTVYNNVSGVDTVMVEQQGSSVNIYFQAENAEAATVSFDAIAPTQVTKQKTLNVPALKLSDPIESYAPIYKEDYENTKTSNLYNKLKSSVALSGIKENMDDAPAGDMPNKLISFGLITLFVVAATRLFKRKEPEMKIGLSQQFNNEAGYDRVQQPMGLCSNPLLSKPFTTVNYGLNAYKNENKNPYETVPMQFHNPKLRNMQTASFQEPARQMAMPKAAVTSSMTATAQQAVNKTAEPAYQSNPNVDNLKFLESMTAIYEKSGRADLARGLKASLSKNNIN
ncbi:MAG: hypothetical protein MJ230_03780 [bacterium]|nr:hypothetical protein [bacterium]